MANPYGVLFATPGARAFTAAGFVSRMPLSMTGIGLITMLSDLRGQYGIAGAVAATFTLSMAFFGPQVSRLVDRFGQSRVLLPVTGVSVAALGLLLLCAHYAAPVWTLFLLAVPSGCMPSMAAMVRARWTELYRDSPRLHTAYALEAVVEDITFIAGPALSVLLCTTLFPEAGPLAAAVLLAVGVALFVMQRGTEPPVRTEAHGGGGSALRSGPLRVLILALVAGGAIVGTVDVVSVAFAHEQGQPGATGLVLAVYAVGSCLAGLAFGAMTLRTPLPRLLVIGLLGTAATTLPFLLVDSVVALTVAVFFAGVFFAPTMITIMNVIERIVPAHRLTEGMTWATTGLATGAALGSALSGAIVDEFGPRGGFAVAIAAGACGVVVAAIGYRPLVTAMAGMRSASQDGDKVLISQDGTGTEHDAVSSLDDDAAPIATPAPLPKAAGDTVRGAGEGAEPHGGKGTVTVAADSNRAGLAPGASSGRQGSPDLRDSSDRANASAETGSGAGSGSGTGTDAGTSTDVGSRTEASAASGATDLQTGARSSADTDREPDFDRQQPYVDCG
ncbi:MFS transporter [Streptomyces zagrosensis]|uniref:MFS family permease n=1 Tax=Streptomyces zagrosensis TaxID=1042984 RepID=A0A7W9Q7M7_9ACTN|nr:MFS transporter [Streptomyces zagrosensis]MBB5935080.1 MFS family permease [Streptomyces zagrosensis]